MIVKKRVYFAHPVSDYGTHWEIKAVQAIADGFNTDYWDVVNPNHPSHEARYKVDGMAYFEELVRHCHGLVWVPFPDRMVGAGVAKEIRAFVDHVGQTVDVARLDREDFKLTFNRVPQDRQILGVVQTRIAVSLYRGDRE